MRASISAGKRWCRSPRIWEAALRWASRASPSRSARMEHSTDDCVMSTCVSFCSCSRFMKWLRVEKPVETRAAEVAAVMAMRIHSNIGAWQLSGTRPCLILDLSCVKPAIRASTLVLGFFSKLSRLDTWSSMVGRVVGRRSQTRGRCFGVYAAKTSSLARRQARMLMTAPRKACSHRLAS